MSLKKESLGGVKSVGVAALLTNVFQLVQLVILARILPPSDFGLMSMAMIVIGLASLIADMGIGSAIIHRQEIPNDVLSSLYWLNYLVGGVICLTLLALKATFADLFNEPQLDEIIACVSLGLIIAPAGQQYRTLLEKNLQFGRVTIIEVVAMAMGVILSIILALQGKGVYALVWGWLTTTSITALTLMSIGRKFWRPSVLFKINAMSDYLRFGLHLVGQRSINYITANVDFLVVGSLLGSQALGYYSLAYNLANLASSRINYILSRVFFPVFSRAKGDTERVKAGFLKMQEYSGIVNVPFLVGLAVTAPLLVPLVFGTHWQPSVILVQVLCVVGLTRSVAGTVGPLLLAKGRADLGFKWSLLVVVLQVPSIFIGAKLAGALGVAIAFAILQFLLLALNYRILIRTLLGPCLRQYLNSVWPSLSMGMVLVFSVLGVGEVFKHVSPHLLLVLQILIGSAIYGYLVWLFKRPFIGDLGSLFRTPKNSQ